jgi:uncharacterized repeat protein (TIGR04076 family)
MQSQYCHDFENILIITETMKKICKYHKRRWQEFGHNEIADTLCFDAYHVAYPYCLAMLYNAKLDGFGKNAMQIKCPRINGVVLEISRRRRWNIVILFSKRILEWLFKKIGFPLDIEDWRIKIKVTKNLGNCPKHKIGDTYMFNIRRTNELCPASFYTLYPYILQLSHGHPFPWENDVSDSHIHCPDHEGFIYDVKCQKVIDKKNNEYNK